jgi:hypothetical protein
MDDLSRTIGRCEEPMRVLRMAASALVLIGTVLCCALLTETIPVAHWGFAISVNFLFMACFTLIFGVLHSPAYGSDYFKARAFERDGEIYRRFGSSLFRSMLGSSGWHRLTWGSRPLSGTLKSLQDFEYRTKGSELVHLLTMICVAGVTVYVGWRHSLRDTLWLVPSNVLLNVYPVLLQRHNRPRVAGLIRRKQATLGAPVDREQNPADRAPEHGDPPARTQDGTARQR